MFKKPAEPIYEDSGCYDWMSGACGCTPEGQALLNNNAKIIAYMNDPYFKLQDYIKKIIKYNDPNYKPHLNLIEDEAFFRGIYDKRG